MSLPESVVELIRLIGHGATMALVRDFGGQALRFPKAEGNDVWAALVESVGEAATRQLAAALGGVEQYIPLCQRALKHDRDRRLVARYDKLLHDGHTSRGAVSVLVREFGPISYRQVEKIVNRPLPDPSPLTGQGELF